MNVEVTIDGPAAGDDTRALYSWLTGEDPLRGQVRLAEPAPRAGELGAVVDTLQILIGSGGVGALSAALLSWIRHRTSDARIVIRRPGGERVEVSVQRIRGLDAASLPRAVEGLSDWVDGKAVDGELADAKAVDGKGIDGPAAGALFREIAAGGDAPGGQGRSPRD